MKQALIIIDCWRYDHRECFWYEGLGLKELNYVIAVSNWTLPTVTSMITGKHPLEHGLGAKPDEDGKVNAHKKRLVKNRYPTLLDREDAIAVTEIPILGMIEPSLPVVRRRRLHRLAWKHMGAPFLILHSRGGHKGWPHANSDDEHEGYKNELQYVSEKIEPLVKAVIEEYDIVVIAADHGRLFKPYYKDHGAEFNLGVLHTPVFYKGKEIDDVLYDTRVIYDILTESRPTPTQVAISCSSAFLEHNRIALSYLSDGELCMDEVTTMKDWDV